MRILRGNRGTSIVEVLVVMIILLVGILTVIRLFPPGFTSVRRAESMTLAGRLAQYEIERWKNNVDNLPDGVLPITTPGSALMDDVFPGPPVSDDCALVFRRVIGETTRIPFGGWSTGPDAGSVYMLAYSPIDTTAVAVRGGDISRRVMSSTNNDPPAARQLKPYEYAMDYAAGKICFARSPQDRTFFVAISWWEQSGNQRDYRSTTDVNVFAPANSDAWIDLKAAVMTHIGAGTAYDITLDAYSDTVSRGFTEVSSWSDQNPYEYRIVDPVLGIIEFNPLGYAQKEFGRPLEARIDYDIADLQIIHEERRAPTKEVSIRGTDTEPYSVRLTLNHIKEHDVTIEGDGNPYLGLPANLGIPDPNDPTDPNKNTRVDVVVIDLQTYRRVDPASFTVNYKDGVVDLNPQITLMLFPNEPPTAATPVVDTDGRNFRILYKAELDFSVQFQKAYAQYERTYADAQGNRPPLNYRSYYVENDTVWFSACNANNTISVDYEYDDNGVARKVLGETSKTTDVLETWFPSNIQRTYLTLKHVPTRIFSVNGVSARARVIWKDGERWRNVDLDTTLVRRSNSH